MNLDKMFAIAGSIVTVALVFVIVSNGNSSSVIKSMGDAFSGSIRAAQGRG
jgi:hypothetical protein